MKKKQLREALAVLLTKLSSARDNPLLMDNYVVKALRTTLVTFKDSGELHEALEENVVMARALVVEQMVHAGFTITSIAYILNRTV